MSYGQNSVYKLMDAKLGVSLFRWSRRVTRVCAQTVIARHVHAYQIPYNRVLTVAHIGIT